MDVFLNLSVGHPLQCRIVLFFIQLIVGKFQFLEKFSLIVEKQLSIIAGSLAGILEFLSA